MNKGALVFAISIATVARAQSPQVLGQLQQLAATVAPGHTPATQVVGGFASAGQELPFMVQLDLGRCYTFLGTVGPGVEQLSIYLFDPTGKTVAKDTTDKSITPHLSHCTKWPGMYKILGKIKRGQGEMAIQGFTYGGGPPSAGPPPQMAPPPPMPPQQSPLAGQLWSLAQATVPGQVPASPAFTGQVGEGQEQPFMVALTPGRCYTFLGTVAPSVQQLSIYLFDPTGRSVAKDTTDRSISPRLTHCATFAGMYKILGKVKRGGGAFAIQAFAPGQ